MRLSLAEARRIGLAAQGFATSATRPRITARDIRAVVRKLGLLQLDFVNVLIPAHYQPVFSRLGPYPRALFDKALYRTPSSPNNGLTKPASSRSRPGRSYDSAWTNTDASSSRLRGLSRCAIPSMRRLYWISCVINGPSPRRMCPNLMATAAGWTGLVWHDPASRSGSPLRSWRSDGRRPPAGHGARVRSSRAMDTRRAPRQRHRPRRRRIANCWIEPPVTTASQLQPTSPIITAYRLPNCRPRIAELVRTGICARSKWKVGATPPISHREAAAPR